VDAAELALGRLAGEHLAGRALVVLAGPQNRVGARYFRVFLDWGDGLLGHTALMLGLLGRGHLPAYNWLEVSNVAPRLGPPGAPTELVLEPEPQGPAADLVHLLARLIPPGGHLMVEYDSPFGRSTARALDAGVPPAATPIGHLMFLAGCGDGFKDWAIAEGWTECPRKLQGYRALDQDHRRAMWRQLAGEMEAFLARSAVTASASVAEARGRGQTILRLLGRARDA